MSTLFYLANFSSWFPSFRHVNVMLGRIRSFLACTGYHSYRMFAETRHQEPVPVQNEHK